MNKLLIILLSLATALTAFAADPTATNYTYDQCRGSQSPYPTDRKIVAYPDTLTPVFINHVGRHGARFPSSAKSITRLKEALQTAVDEKTITAEGKEMITLITRIEATVAGRWGSLDSLGEAEERGIASRMYAAYKPLFADGASVEAISSYSPRCIMSMYSFAHQLSRLSNKLEISTSSGRKYSYLLRPFDIDAEYKAYRQSDGWEQTLEAFRAQDISLVPIARVLGKISQYEPADLRELAMDEYVVVAGAAAAGVGVNISRFFTREEYNKQWAAYNMRQYLLYASNTVSTIPGDMASPLVTNIVTTTESVVNGEKGMPQVMLRFGHAETLMPLLSLLRLRGCYYMTNYFDTVGLHWKDFDIVPMGANVQFILFKSKSGAYYLRVDLNEEPVPLMPGSEVIYLPWTQARDYMTRCIPIYM